jgi:hypothetical protein
MANFANLQNNIVQQIIVVSDTIDDGQAWCVETYGGVWVDGTNANIGWTYNGTDFIAPQPYPSWTLDANNDWQPPTPMPTDGGMYRWNEEELVWAGI